MKRVDAAVLDDLSRRAAASARLRLNLNLHGQESDPVQRLCNALEPGTYVRPHRHAEGRNGGDRWELFVALRGVLAVLTFAEDGTVLTRDELRPEEGTVLLEIPGGAWHALAALAPRTVFFEIKPGPYVAASDKDFAAWAPAEGAPDTARFEAWLRQARPGDRPPVPRSG